MDLMIKYNQFKIKNINILKNYYGLIVVFIGRFLYYLSLHSYVVGGDTNTYIWYNFDVLFNLNGENSRVPIYPTIIKFTEKITNSHNQEQIFSYVINIQIVISFLSIYIFYLILKKLFKNKHYINICTIGYGLSTVVMGWDNVILTESFSLSITILYIFLMIKFIKEKKFYTYSLTLFVSTIACFLKPSFLLILLITICFAFFPSFDNRLVGNKKYFYSCNIPIIILCLGCISYYSFSYSKEHEIFSLDDSLPRQQLYNIISTDLYNYSDDKDFILTVNKVKEESESWNVASTADRDWKIMVKVLKKYGNKRSMELSNEIIKKNFVEYLSTYYLPTIFKTLNQEYISIGDREINSIDTSKFILNLRILYVRLLNSLQIFKLSHTVIIGMLGIICYFIKLCKSKKNDYVILGLSAISIGIYFFTYYGTCGEYPRTMVCAFPFMYLLLIYLIYEILKQFFDWKNSIIRYKKEGG